MATLDLYRQYAGRCSQIRSLKIAASNFMVNFIFLLIRDDAPEIPQELTQCSDGRAVWC